MEEAGELEVKETGGMLAFTQRDTSFSEAFSEGGRTSD